MKLSALLIAILLYAGPVSAQGTFTVQWDASPSPVNGYRVQFGQEPGTYISTLDVIGMSAAYSYPSPGSYYVSVQAFRDVTDDSGQAQRLLSARATSSIAISPQPPPPTGTSPDGTFATTIVDCMGHTWTISTQRATLQDGVVFGDLAADTYYLKSCLVYANVTGGGWYESGFNPDRWAPSPDPRPQPPPFTFATTVTIRSCPVYVEAPKPVAATGTGWVVQYFDGATAITSASATRKRSVTLTPGTHAITAVWTKEGQPSMTSQTLAYTCH